MNQDKQLPLSKEQSNPKTAEKSTWQKPNLQKLNVSLDTALGVVSGGDGMSMTTPN